MFDDTLLANPGGLDIGRSEELLNTVILDMDMNCGERGTIGLDAGDFGGNSVSIAQCFDHWAALGWLKGQAE
jgi:hypothetical protein